MTGSLASCFGLVADQGDGWFNDLPPVLCVRHFNPTSVPAGPGRKYEDLELMVSVPSFPGMQSPPQERFLLMAVPEVVETFASDVGFTGGIPARRAVKKHSTADGASGRLAPDAGKILLYGWRFAIPFCMATEPGHGRELGQVGQRVSLTVSSDSPWKSRTPEVLGSIVEGDKTRIDHSMTSSWMVRLDEPVVWERERRGFPGKPQVKESDLVLVHNLPGERAWVSPVKREYTPLQLSMDSLFPASSVLIRPA
jgi:hypothetical protein